MAVKFTKTNLLRSPQPEVKPKAEAKAKTETKGAPTIDGGVATPNNTVVTRADPPGTPPAPTSTPNVELPDSLPVVPTPTFGANSTPVTATGVAPDALKDLEIAFQKSLDLVEANSNRNPDVWNNGTYNRLAYELHSDDIVRRLESLKTKMTKLNTKLTDVNNLVKSYNSEETKSEETYTKYLEALEEYNSYLQTVNEEYESLRKSILSFMDNITPKENKCDERIESIHKLSEHEKNFLNKHIWK